MATVNARIGGIWENVRTESDDTNIVALFMMFSVALHIIGFRGEVVVAPHEDSPQRNVEPSVESGRSTPVGSKVNDTDGN